MNKKSNMTATIEETKKEEEQTKHLVCGFCPAFVYAHLEPNGEYKYLDGLPICARCRILKGRKASEIIADREHLDEDLKLKNDMRQKKADEIAIEVAIATQEETQTQMIKS